MDRSRDSVGRGHYFIETERLIREIYLSDDAGPYLQSGRSSGAARWEETRRLFADLVDRSGSYLDVGCANGLLLESMLGWLDATGRTIEPFGVDFIPELVDLARLRVPTGRFWVANAWDWQPPRSFDHVRTNVEYVRPADRPEFIRRQAKWVSPDGRLVVAHYPGRNEEPIEVTDLMIEAALDPAGSTTVDTIRVAWWNAPA